MKKLLQTLTLTSLLLVALAPLGATAARAQNTAATTGTAAEARAMFDKAVAALQADKAKAIEDFNAGASGFKDRDLYVFTANASDGVFTAHPRLKGQKLSDLKEKGGRAFGAEIMGAATEGKVSEVAYDFPKPGTDAPVPKVAYVGKVGDQVVAVGYYK